MAQLVALLILIHVVGSPDSYCLRCESAHLVWCPINHVVIVPVCCSDSHCRRDLCLQICWRYLLFLSINSMF